MVVACGSVKVDVAEALLFVDTVSLVAVTVTVFVMFPELVTGTDARIVTTAVSPGAKVGIVTFAVLLEPDATVPAVDEPMTDVPETKVKPVGSVSTTETDVAVDGPLLVTLSVYVI
jgi:hypothetical protein